MLFKIFQEQRNMKDRGFSAQGLQRRGAVVKNWLNRVGLGQCRRRPST